MFKRICLVLVILFASTFSIQSQSNVITLDPSTTFQTMRGLGAVTNAGQWLFPTNGTVSDNPAFLTFRNQLFDQAVNDLGLSQIRLEILSGTENTRDIWAEYKAGQITGAQERCLRYSVVNDNGSAGSINSAGFHFTRLDEQINKVVLPLRAVMAARGEVLHINLCYVSFTNQMTGSGCPGGLSNLHSSNPAEYAEFVLATYQHMQTRFGFVPDTWEIMLEPSNGNHWMINQMGPAIVAAGNRLAAAGFTPRFVVPSSVTRPTALQWFDQLIQTPGARQYIDTLSFHTYNGWNDPSGLAQFAARAKANNIHSAMLEHIGATVDELHAELKHANVSSWLAFTLASPSGSSTPIGDNKLFHVSGSTVSITDFFARYARQYFRHVRPGAVRIGAAGNANFDPLAFRNQNGRLVVVVKAGSGGSFTVQGLPAGLYGVYYTTATQTASQPDQQVSGSLTATIPASGVITIYAKTGSAPPPPPPVNQAPVVQAGPDQTVVLPALAVLAGQVSDDGLPAPPASFTQVWSQVSGPGVVTFAGTSASFSAAGAYVLRLTANDSLRSASDDVAVQVNTTPTPQPTGEILPASFGVVTGVQAAAGRRANYARMVQAIAAATSTNKLLRFPAGVIEVEVPGGQLKAFRLKGGLTLTGAGTDSTSSLRFYPDSPTFAYYGFALDPRASLSLKDVSIVGPTNPGPNGALNKITNAINQSGQQGTAYNLPYFVRLERVRIEGEWYVAIQGGSGDGPLELIDCDITGYTQCVAWQATYNGGKTFLARNTRFHDAGIPGKGHLIYLSKPVSMDIDNCTFAGNHRLAIHHYGSGTIQPAKAILQNSTFENTCANGIETANVAQTKIINCRFNVQDRAINLTGNALIEDCQFNGCSINTYDDHSNVTVNINRCKFTNGAVITSVWKGCTWNITDCEFDGCSTCIGNSAPGTKMNITSGKFRGAINRAVVVSGGQAVVANSSFEGSFNEGGVIIETTDPLAKLLVQSCDFRSGSFLNTSRQVWVKRAPVGAVTIQ